MSSWARTCCADSSPRAGANAASASGLLRPVQRSRRIRRMMNLLRRRRRNMSKFEVKEIVPVTDGSSVDLRPQWNVDASSIVFERKTAAGSMLFRLELCATRSGKAEPISLCNKGRPKYRDAQHSSPRTTSRSSAIDPEPRGVASGSQSRPCRAPDIAGRRRERLRADVANRFQRAFRALSDRRLRTTPPLRGSAGRNPSAFGDWSSRWRPALVLAAGETTGVPLQTRWRRWHL